MFIFIYWLETVFIETEGGIPPPPQFQISPFCVRIVSFNKTIYVLLEQCQIAELLNYAKILLAHVSTLVNNSV